MNGCQEKQVGFPNYGTGSTPRGRDVRYAAYFHHFNREDYYEAHDVLESLWLEEGRKARGAAFLSGIDPVGGGLSFICESIIEYPGHRVHQQRLAPAYRLLGLAEQESRPDTEKSGREFGLEVISRINEEDIKAVLSSGELS